MRRNSLVFALSLLASSSLFAGVGLALPRQARAADAADAAAERLTGNVPEELQAYRDTSTRFAARMDELEADTRRYIDVRETEERAKVASGYDALISSLEDLETSRRQQAVEIFEEFLRVYPNADYSSHVRFRLAELYFEVQKDKWLQNMESYSVLEKACTEGDDEACETLPEQPLVDLSPAIALYKRIIADNRDLPADQQYEFLDGTYYMLGFTYTDPNSAQKDEDLAQANFEELIQVRPDSDLADAAHLFLGNHYFDYNKLDLAIGHYQAVFDKGDQGKYFAESMYQLAWAYYKMALEPEEYDRALDMFVKVLEYSDKEFLESGRQSDYRPDAIKYMAISLFDISEKDPDRDALEVTRDYFASQQHRDYEWDVYTALGEVLTQQSQFDAAIALYTFLQDDPRWANRPENPDFQWMIVKLWVSGAFQDVVASGQARVVLTERYGDQSTWWEANRNNPEALAKARQYIESSLADVAVEYYLRAEETQDIADYDASIEKFREFLDKFPMSDDYYKQQWYLALTLERASTVADEERSLALVKEAAKEFQLLIKSRRHHPHGDGAVYRHMLARKAIAEMTWGSFDKAPEGAEVERAYPRVDNKKDPESGEPIQIQVYKLPQEHVDFIEAADQVLKWRFKAPENPDDPDFAAAINEARPALMYIPGQILFYYNRYDEARPRLVSLIQNPDGSRSPFRTTLEASYAAGLIVDSYLNEGDLAKVRLWTTEFIKNPVGPPEMIAVNKEKLGDTLEGVAFKQCLQLVDVDDRAGAADCFQQFLVDFPSSEYANVALYNAANSLQIIGKAEQAIGLFEQYVNKYPDDPNSEGLYFRIATTYESTFNLEQAIKYYEQLVKLFPENPDAAAAWYNAAFLRIGIGDNAGAARAFEKYAERFPNEGDTEEVYWEAGEQWEIVGRFQAKQFYERYLKDSRFRGKNLDHYFEAQYKLATFALDEKNTKLYNKMLDDLLASFRQVAADPAQSGRLGFWARHYAAEAAFREVQAQFDLVTKDKLTGNEEKDVKLLTETKAPEIKAFNDLASSMTQYGDLEYILAATYLMGAAQLYFANLGFGLQCPTKYSADECDVFMEVVETQIHPMFFPVQEQATALLTKVIDTAREKGRHFVWVDKAQQALNDLNPIDYPAIKPELRGGTDSTIYPVVRPFDMPDPSRGNANISQSNVQSPATPDGGEGSP